jgi:hypothetical protein
MAMHKNRTFDDRLRELLKQDIDSVQQEYIRFSNGIDIEIANGHVIITLEGGVEGRFKLNSEQLQLVKNAESEFLTATEDSFNAEFDRLLS